MSTRLIRSLSLEKYARLLPKLFPGASGFALCDLQGAALWQHPGQLQISSKESDWSDFEHEIQRHRAPQNRLCYRAGLRLRESGRIGWLVVLFDTASSVPLLAGGDALRRAFSDACLILQDDLELHLECDQLAIELTERYEELNLVYDTKDEVEYFEEGQQALTRLVHNCSDYLNVGFAVLICRDRNLVLQSAKAGLTPSDIDAVLELLSTRVYDRVESQVSSVILNNPDEEDRQRLFDGRSENILAQPVVDDYGSALGILAVVSGQRNHHFSNGDRNLLEVMAKKASRIIHTHHDALTGLLNRNGFEPALLAAITTSRQLAVQHCLLHVDLDQLHVVNDLMGHQEGDALIRRAARVLRSSLRDSDLIARLGGDEFAVLLSKCPAERGQQIAEKLCEAIRSLSVIKANRQLDITASVGLAFIGPETDSIVSAMASAEIACKAAKEQGRDRVEIFADDNTVLIRRSEEIEWIGRIQKALREDAFVLFCQPVVPAPGKEHAPHFEVLLRLNDGDEILSPAAFIPAAERYQLMPQVDRWVVREAIRHIEAEWMYIRDVDPVFCINLSGQSLTNNGFFTFLTDELERSPVPNSAFCFEITETAAIANIDEAIYLMSTLSELGCAFSLDDFGAGLSSFGYLKVLPVDYLKIDGSFVLEITSDDVSRAMVEAICQIAATMGLKTIAEFVCDEATVDLLAGIGVDYLQGYHTGKPVPLLEITNRLRKEVTLASA